MVHFLGFGKCGFVCNLDLNSGFFWALKFLFFVISALLLPVLCWSSQFLLSHFLPSCIVPAFSPLFYYVMLTLWTLPLPRIPLAWISSMFLGPLLWLKWPLVGPIPPHFGLLLFSSTAIIRFPVSLRGLMWAFIIAAAQVKVVLECRCFLELWQKPWQAKAPQLLQVNPNIGTSACRRWRSGQTVAARTL